MKKKLIRIIICILMIMSTILPVVGTLNDEAECYTSNMEDEWSMFLHDPKNTGYSTSPTPQTNTIKWIYTAGEEISSSPAIVNGKVYISTYNEYFYCLDADTGEELWSYYDDGFAACSPAVYDGKVYVASDYDYFYCLDADTGDDIWKFYKGYGFSFSSPAVVGGRVYFAHSRGSGSGRNASIYCLDATTGDKFWGYDMGYLLISSPAVSHGKVYIGSEDSKLYCFDAYTGSILWDYDVGWTPYTSPSVSDDKVYIGGDAVYCLDADNGSKIWSNTTIGYVSSSPIVAYGNVYILSCTSEIHCFDKDTGEQIWNHPTGNIYYTSPAAADGKVYAGIWETGKLLCLNASTGEKLWEYKTSHKEYLVSSPAVAYGRVYMSGGTTNNLYCFEDPFLPPPSIKGPPVGLIGFEYGYQFMAEDPEGDVIKYCVDWDDGTTSGWIGPHPSGEWITVNHSWSNPGNYSIRARGEYANGIRSNWSEPHNITVIDGPLLEILLVKGGLLKVNAVIKNLGTKEATDVNWNIKLKGGSILLGKETTGTDNIPVNEEITVTSKLILGLGPTTVTVNATVPIGFSDTREQKAFVVLFFIMVKPGG